MVYQIFNFYDYFFQREVPQDGYTNPAGTQWIRNDKDKTTYDFPSPKKQRMNPTKSVGQTSKASPSKVVSDGKERQVSAEYTQQMVGTKEESEDKGLKIEDLITPGSDQLRFGSFDTMEIC